MSATITRKDGSVSTVKNLGWVLRNWMRIKSLGWVDDDSRPMCDGFFFATMNDGAIYITSYASYSVFMRWVNRPIFYGLPLSLNRKALKRIILIHVGDIPKDAIGD